MTRDMDLIRRILLEVEEHTGSGAAIQLQIPGYESNVVAYHMMLLDEAGYIEGRKTLSQDAWGRWFVLRLTWQGHEFVDSVRDETVWGKTKDQVGDKVTSVSLAVIQEVATGVARSLLGLG